MPVIVRTGKGKQGSTDKDSAWAKAQARWIAQLLVRLGIISPTNDPENSDIDWWDET